MGEKTGIEWTDHTFNPWIGCTRVSDACDNCYAATMSHRRKWARFEPRAPRRRTTADYWLQPYRWNRRAEDSGSREKVFGPSLADPFDAEVSREWRDDYVRLIEETPSLDYILLTKRPQVARKYFDRRKVPDNLWLGITAENQKMLDLRGPAILAIPARIHVLSAEPLLGPLDLSNGDPAPRPGAVPAKTSARGQRGFTWVIAGGESGPGARPSHPDWFRSLRDQCIASDIPFHFKQWGEWRGHESAEDRPAAARRAWSDGHISVRVGRAAAGAQLDGRAWREFPI